MISCTLWSLMSLSPLILLIAPFWIVLWVAWDYLIGFVKLFFFSQSGSSQVQARYWSWRAMCRDGGIPPGLSFECGFHL